MPKLRPLCSTGVTRLCHYYGPLRHPTRPSLLLAEFSLPVTRRHCRGFPCSVSSLLPTCRRQYPGGIAGHSSLSPPLPAGGIRPRDGGLRRFSSGSAPALPVSRLAQRSLTLRPVDSLTPQGSLFLRCFSPIRYLLEPPQVLPAGATSRRAGFAPARIDTSFTAHWEMSV